MNSSRPNPTTSPRISLLADKKQQGAPLHALLPFLMEDDTSSKKLEVQECDTKQYVVSYALHYALLHGRNISADEIFLTSSSSTTTDGSSVVSTTSEARRKLVFPMAELLLQNGADTSIVDSETGLTLAELVGMGPIVDDNAIMYISMKNTARGHSVITRSSAILNQHLLSLEQQYQLQQYYEDGKKEEGLVLIEEENLDSSSIPPFNGT